jgi:hypothetical protein
VLTGFGWVYDTTVLEFGQGKCALKSFDINPIWKHSRGL